MDIKRLEEIMDADYPITKGDRTLLGLKILSKYAPGEYSVICHAEHDIIYSIGVDTAIENGITEEEVIELRHCNWMIDEGAFAKFV
jgi:hypothetical protein